jgi:hypothetical protein
VRDAANYTANDLVVIQPGDSELEEIGTVASVTARTITLSSATIYNHGVNADVWELTTPTTLHLTVRSPDSSNSTYSIAGAGLSTSTTGVHYADATYETEGEWQYRSSGTGACIAASEGRFVIRESSFV